MKNESILFLSGVLFPYYNERIGDKPFIIGEKMGKTNDVQLLFKNYKEKFYTKHSVDMYEIISDIDDYKTCFSELKFRCKKHNFEYSAGALYAERSNNALCKMCDKEERFNEFKVNADNIYNGLYEYSADEYTDSHTPMKILCNIHGYFIKAPVAHLFGKQGCQICSKEKERNENFLKLQNRLLDVHGIKYKIISSVEEYSTLNSSMTCSCEQHGAYRVKNVSSVLTSKNGLCPECIREDEADNFIRKSIEMHGNKYTYFKDKYIDSRNYTEILCNKHNKIFKQRPSAHVQGQGCPDCGRLAAIENSTKTNDKFIEEIIELYGNKYDFSKTVYTGAFNKVTVICKKHGEQKVSANNLLSGRSCSECNKENFRDKMEKEFPNKAKEVHGDSYDYSLVKYKNNRKSVEIRCKRHDHIFLLSPNKHLNGNGCPICAKEVMNRWTINAIIKNKEAFDNKTGECYLFKISSNSEIYYKIGFTSITSEDRIKLIIGELPNYKCEIIARFNGSLMNSIKLEKVLHKFYDSKRFKIPPLNFGGKTELFNLDEYDITKIITLFNTINVGILDHITSNKIQEHIINEIFKEVK